MNTHTDDTVLRQLSDIQHSRKHLRRVPRRPHRIPSAFRGPRSGAMPATRPQLLAAPMAHQHPPTGRRGPFYNARASSAAVAVTSTRDAIAGLCAAAALSNASEPLPLSLLSGGGGYGEGSAPVYSTATVMP
mmetsp:Transcript_2635/g.9135  ORF Transcript_2635/g.9135 Transcript_2635/m.9135 type:complete len:132 (+) Transcript_2635:92-487(+)